MIELLKSIVRYDVETHMKKLKEVIDAEWDLSKSKEKTEKAIIISLIKNCLFNSQYKYVSDNAFSNKKFFLDKTIHGVFICAQSRYVYKIIATDKYGNLWVYSTNDQNKFCKDHKLINMFGLSEKFKK